MLATTSAGSTPAQAAAMSPEAIKLEAFKVAAKKSVTTAEYTTLTAEVSPAQA